MSCVRDAQDSSIKPQKSIISEIILAPCRSLLLLGAVPFPGVDGHGSPINSVQTGSHHCCFVNSDPITEALGIGNSLSSSASTTRKTTNAAPKMLENI